MNIVFLVFGTNISYHLQTYFAIISVLKWKRPDDTVTLYTDNRELYIRLQGHIAIEFLEKSKLDEWIDNTGYIFRAKIKAIEDSAEKHPGKNLLFLDGDTFVRGRFDEIDTAMNQHNAIMHTDEGHPSKMRGASLRMWKAVKGARFGDFAIGGQHNVWNSGVIGIPKDKLGEVIPLALQVCDHILRQNVACFTAEQYAFAVAMQQRCTVIPATEWVAHYWGNKEQWHEIATGFFMRSYMQGRTVDEEIEAFAALNLADVPLSIRKPNTQRRLVKLVKKLFPDKIM